jgi:selenocysteine lyase/cysteine desulfurase
MKTIDWNQERQNFPAALSHAYLLTAAVGPISNLVYRAYERHYRGLLENGDYNWLDNVNRLEQVRVQAAQFLAASSPQEVGFSSSTSMAMNYLATMMASHLRQSGAPLRILSCQEEFPSTTVPWLYQKFEVIQVPAAQLMAEVERQQPTLVVTSAVQFGTGYRQDLKMLGEVCRQNKAQLIVNATQALGAFPINVKECNITALTATCHKWMCCGYGLCLLYVSPELSAAQSPALAGWLSMKDPLAMNNRSVDVKSDATAVEVGIPGFAAIGALGEHLQTIERMGIERIAARILELSSYAHRELTNVCRVASTRTNSPSLTTPDSGILMLQINDAEAIAQKLGEQNIYVSVRQGGLRIATHYFNNHQDVDRLVDGLKGLL